MGYVNKIVLNYIIAFKSCNGFAPTREEIKLGLNTRSDSWVAEQLAQLEDNGYIVRYDNSPRAINVIKFPD